MANTIKGLLPSGKAPSVLKAEIIELIKTEAPAPDLSAYATKEEVEQASTVQRLALTAPLTAISTSAWDTSHAYALVITQDSVGGRAATYEGEEIPLDKTPGQATITAWVHDGQGWVWRSSAAEPAPTAPPAWPEGTTVSNGAIEATSAEFIFSQPLPARATVQYRAGSGDSWRTVSSASSQSVKVAGLTPSTSYPAFDFQLINQAGSSAAITAAPFKTPVKPPAWEMIRHATFTTGNEVPLAEYVPDLGPQLVETTPRTPVKVEGGTTKTTYGGANFAPNGVQWLSLGEGTKKLRLTSHFSGIAITGNIFASAELKILTDRNVPALGVSILPGRAVTLQATTGNGSVEELIPPGIVPASSGVAVLTGEEDVFTFSIDGVELGKWRVTWGTQFGAVSFYNGATFGVGGNDVHSGNQVSSVKISELKVEAWK